AERVWEPDLPGDLAAAGVRYLPLDDTQLHQVGLPPERVRGGFETESAGALVRVFPAMMSLRYRIPYAPPEEAAAFVADPFPGGGGGLAVYADDGEKFGVWPGTHRLVYEERWLERFLAALPADGERFAATTFAREMQRRAEGLVYLPAGSYAEMGSWALPPEMQEAHARARERLAEQEMGREADLFVRGGFWRGFFARYPESSWMHLRVDEALRRCREPLEGAGRTALRAAREHLWRAQCNCAYWHGVFGGLYLSHLRAGIYRELIRGEALMARARRGDRPWVDAREADLDGDGEPEVVLENEAVALFVDPGEGGRLIEWDDRASAMNLVNTLARRPEAYHRRLREEAAESPGQEARTIHGSIRAREPGLIEWLLYDAEGRAGLVDRFFAERPAAEALRRGALSDGCPQGACGVELEREAGETRLRLSREVEAPGASGGRLSVEKLILLRAGERGFRVRWRYRNESEAPLAVWAGSEQHINLLAGSAPDRWVELDGRASTRRSLSAQEDARPIRSVALVDEWLGISVLLRFDRPVELARYPVETVSLSESGAERNYQGSAFIFMIRIELAPGAETGLELEAEVRSGLPGGGAGEGEGA
ncbi:MAG: DUF1926 domain-containing protein, partial [Candidatus Eisenbacteria bacterium]|nr:DUF1926 domain-containing protein [Candidatus Eisenbacteria bacterium]